MSEMIERVALRLFWKAEHLDPTEEGDVPESEYGEGWPSKMSERKREFWRQLAHYAIAEMRDPTDEMAHAAYLEGYDTPRSAWVSMIDEALK